VTAILASLRSTFAHLIDDSPGPPDADLVLSPFHGQDAAAILDTAAEHRLKVRFWGGGTHQGYGHPVDADLVVTTRRMTRLVEWRPEDLVAVVPAGMTVAALEDMLTERRQSAILPERPGAATVGGVVATGASGWRRLYYGPTRDRMLEVVLATGDGRIVTGGGRVVKNVSGYDLPRLAAGSFGSLGLIVQVAVKLWPLGKGAATVAVDDVEAALGEVFRPLAVIELDGAGLVFLAGTVAEVDAQAAAVGGTVRSGLHWPEPLAGRYEAVIRVPPALVRQAVEQIPAGWSYQAAFGVGEVRIAGDDADVTVLTGVRRWAEDAGGAVVTVRAPVWFDRDFDPWGTVPGWVELQRRVKLAFDPLAVCNPGILPGGA
jgi:glycolate oxidase FAD binding subunit